MYTYLNTHTHMHAHYMASKLKQSDLQEAKAWKMGLCVTLMLPGSLKTAPWNQIHLMTLAKCDLGFRIVK